VSVLNPDERFEIYLARFHPLAPEPLRYQKEKAPMGGRLVLAAWCVAFAAIVVAVLAIAWLRVDRSGSPGGTALLVRANRPVSPQPWTIGRANAMLAGAASIAAAIDQIGLEPRAAALPKGKRSALSVLSKEEPNL
jgi:hypothetical protein